MCSTMYILAPGDGNTGSTVPQHPQKLRESPSEKADMREAPCGLGTALPYPQPLQLGQNTTVILVPHKVLAKTLNSTSSFRDVNHLSAISSLSPERLRSSTNLLRGVSQYLQSQ